MGYTTEFSGEFKFPRPVDAEIVLRLRELADLDYRDKGFPKNAPDAYLQWEISGDRTALRWDGNEKFYQYEEWLCWLIENVFAPAGNVPEGSMIYRGEDADDVGTLAIVDGKVTKAAAVFR